ncbi:uncharacterized protein A4U43_UnF1160, partial [Asparagus officinalis]
MVVSGASSSARGHGIDRFYNPPAVRRQLQHALEGVACEWSGDRRGACGRGRIDSSSKLAVTSSSNSNSSSLPPSTPPTPAGNLDRFIESTTPVVPVQYRRKTSVRRWRSSDYGESCPYFDLKDLWESFKEWSAYGAGVPLILNGNDDAIVQYYVPYLSGIQLYVHPSRHSLRSRKPVDESDVEAYQDTSSEASGSSDSYAGQEGPFGNDRECRDQAIRPIFEYLARDSPYGREPLADKISALASKFPSLKIYRSCDLLPSSWMSVAWYPIYRIPTGHTLKDLDACFLTFHSLSTPAN